MALALLTGAPTRPLGPPTETGECRWVHGRFNLWNGSSVRRIWIIGTDRIVALRDEDTDVPAVIEKYLDARAYLKKSDGLFGDFEVCAVEPSWPGHMQHVRLRAAKDLVFRGRPFGPASE
jgi:hypothetical protein